MKWISRQASNLLLGVRIPPRAHRIRCIPQNQNRFAPAANLSSPSARPAPTWVGAPSWSRPAGRSSEHIICSVNYIGYIIIVSVRSSIWQSSCLLSNWLKVRVLPRGPFDAPLASLGACSWQASGAANGGEQSRTTSSLQAQ